MGPRQTYPPHFKLLSFYIHTTAPRATLSRDAVFRGHHARPRRWRNLTRAAAASNLVPAEMTPERDNVGYELGRQQMVHLRREHGHEFRALLFLVVGEAAST